MFEILKRSDAATFMKRKEIKINIRMDEMKKALSSKTCDPPPPTEPPPEQPPPPSVSPSTSQPHIPLSKQSSAQISTKQTSTISFKKPSINNVPKHSTKHITAQFQPAIQLSSQPAIHLSGRLIQSPNQPGTQTPNKPDVQSGQLDVQTCGKTDVQTHGKSGAETAIKTGVQSPTHAVQLPICSAAAQLEQDPSVQSASHSSTPTDSSTHLSVTSPQQATQISIVSTPPQKERTEDEEKICRKFIWGTCEKHYTQCRFKHIRDIPFMIKTLKFCHDFQNHGCNRPNCSYLHTKREEESSFLTKGEIPQVLLDRYAKMEARIRSQIEAGLMSVPLQLPGQMTPQLHSQMQGQMAPMHVQCPKNQGLAPVPPQMAMPQQMQGPLSGQMPPTSVPPQIPPQIQGTISPHMPVPPHIQNSVPSQIQAPLQAQMQNQMVQAGAMPPQVHSHMHPQIQGHVPSQMQGHMPPQMQSHMHQQMQGHVPPHLQGHMPPQMQGHMLPQIQGRVPLQLQATGPPQIQSAMIPQVPSPVSTQVQSPVTSQIQGQALSQIPSQASQMQVSTPSHMHGPIPPQVQNLMTPHMQNSRPPQIQSSLRPQIPGSATQQMITDIPTCLPSQIQLPPQGPLMPPQMMQIPHKPTHLPAADSSTRPAAGQSPVIPVSTSNLPPDNGIQSVTTQHNQLTTQPQIITQHNLTHAANQVEQMQNTVFNSVHPSSITTLTPIAAPKFDKTIPPPSFRNLALKNETINLGASHDTSKPVQSVENGFNTIKRRRVGNLTPTLDPASTQDETDICEDCVQRNKSLARSNKLIEHLMCEEADRELICRQNNERLQLIKDNLVDMVGTDQAPLLDEYIDGKLRGGLGNWRICDLISQKAGPEFFFDPSNSLKLQHLVRAVVNDHKIGHIEAMHGYKLTLTPDLLKELMSLCIRKLGKQNVPIVQRVGDEMLIPLYDPNTPPPNIPMPSPPSTSGTPPTTIIPPTPATTSVIVTRGNL